MKKKTLKEHGQVHINNLSSDFSMRLLIIIEVFFNNHRWEKSG